MSEINLFKVNDVGVAEIDAKKINLEKRVQDLIEQNLDELLGINFLDSEYSTGKKHGGRIDTLGIDENNAPVIIEYKKSKNQNVINQGLYYLDWMMDHKAEFEQLVNQKTDIEEVEWSSPRLLCIAPDFTKYDSHAVDQIEKNIELMRFRQYEENLLLLQLVNVVESTSTEGSNIEYKGIEDYYEQADESLVEIVKELEDFIFSLGDDVQKKKLKHYYAYKRIQNFVCLEVKPQKKKIKLYLHLDPKKIEDLPKTARDVTNIGHYGTGDLEVSITNEEDLALIKPLIEKSYEGVSS